MANKIHRVRLSPSGVAFCPEGDIVHVYQELEGKPPTLVVIGPAASERRQMKFEIAAPGWNAPEGFDYIGTYHTKEDGIRIVFRKKL